MALGVAKTSLNKQKNGQGKQHPRATGILLAIDQNVKTILPQTAKTKTIPSQTVVKAKIGQTKKIRPGAPCARDSGSAKTRRTLVYLKSRHATSSTVLGERTAKPNCCLSMHSNTQLTHHPASVHFSGPPGRGSATVRRKAPPTSSNLLGESQQRK
jgi:hypothetical protein